MTPSGTSAKSSKTITILVATMTGNSMDCAEELAGDLRSQGCNPAITPIQQYDARKLLKAEGTVLIITSTFGNGEPPDCAYRFWEVLLHPKYPSLNHLSFGVLALGDSSYPKFCQFGKDLDARLEDLGAHRLVDRIDCDVDYEESFAEWKAKALEALA